MKELYKFLGYFGIGFFACFWLMKATCEGGAQKGTAIVPEIKGSFPAVKPVHVPLEENYSADDDQKSSGKKNGEKAGFSGKNVANTGNVSRASETHFIDSLKTENQKLRELYATASDSLKTSMFNSAISLKAFDDCWENDDLALQVHGFVRGEVQSIAPTWTIKSRKMPSTEKKFAFLAGGDMGIAVPVGNFRARGLLFFQNRNGDLIFGGYDTDRTISAGFAKEIFAIKK